MQLRKIHSGLNSLQAKPQVPNPASSTLPRYVLLGFILVGFQQHPHGVNYAAHTAVNYSQT